MDTWYLDTSAAMKLLVFEEESPAFVEAIDTEKPLLTSSTLLVTELNRARQRRASLDASSVNDLLFRLQIFDLDRLAFQHAGALPGKHLRSLDAIHISAAMLGGCTTMVTYDHRMAEAAENSGLEVVSPGPAANR